MYCTHCGTQVADTDKFCPECGAPIVRPAETTSSSLPDGKSTSPYTGEASPAPEPKKKSHKALWITLTCVAAAIALAAIAIFVWHPWSRTGAKENPLADVTSAPEKPLAELTPEEAVREAFEKLNEADSMHLDFVEDVSVSVGIPAISYTQDMNISLVLDVDSDKANGMSRIEGTVSAMGFEQNVIAYGETVDGSVLTYSSTDGGTTWTLNDSQTVSDPTASVDTWMQHAKDFEKTGTEQVNGFDTTVYTGTLSGECVKDATGMAGEMFGSLDEATLEGLDDFPITFWIDNESGRVVRIVLDMNAMMATLMENALMESIGELPAGMDMDLSIDIKKAEVVCDLSKFNEIPPIVIPDEARGNGTAHEPAAEADSIVGTWELDGGEDEQTQQYVDMMLGLGMNMVFVFNEDGTGSVSTAFQGEEDKQEFTYTLENGEIVIDGQGAPYRIEDGLLHLTADDAKLVFKRK